MRGDFFMQYYVVICGLPGFTIFSALTPKQHDFRKQCLEHKNHVAIFSTNFVRNISHSKKNPERSFFINMHAFMCCTCQTFGAGIIFFLILAHPVYKM